MDLEGRRRSYLGLAGVLAGAAAMLALALALAALAVGRGWVGGPTIDVALGDLRLIARTTTRPECLPLTQHECFVGFPNPPAATPATYAIWAGRITELPSEGSSPRVTVSQGHFLLKIVVRRQPLAGP